MTVLPSPRCTPCWQSECGLLSLATLQASNLCFGAQTYLSMLCSMRWGLFFFFAGMCVLMTITVYGFYPETKGLGIEETPRVFQKHWCAALWDQPACVIERPISTCKQPPKYCAGKFGLHDFFSCWDLSCCS